MSKNRADQMVERLRNMQAAAPDIEASAVVSVDGLIMASALQQGVEEDRVSAFSILAAGFGVGILTIPLVASVSEDAMYAVPGALREAAYGIGARRRTVTTKVVFPAAVSGIVASLILGFSRAIGETMIVAIAAGATSGALRHIDPLTPGQTMTGAISSLAIGSDQVKSASGFNPFLALYFVGLLLFVITFALNIASERFVRRVRRDY